MTSAQSPPFMETSINLLLGTIIGLILEKNGYNGTMLIISMEGSIIAPPADEWYAVEPDGVENITPSPIISNVTPSIVNSISSVFDGRLRPKVISLSARGYCCFFILSMYFSILPCATFVQSSLILSTMV